MQDNLSNRIHDAKFNANGESLYLSNSEQQSLLALVSKKCQKKTITKLAIMLGLPLALWNDYGIYKRVTFNDGQVDYICGQSWTDEMRTLRKCILG